MINKYLVNELNKRICTGTGIVGLHLVNKEFKIDKIWFNVVSENAVSSFYFVDDKDGLIEHAYLERCILEAKGKKIYNLGIKTTCKNYDILLETVLDIYESENSEGKYDLVRRIIFKDVIIDTCEYVYCEINNAELEIKEEYDV